MREAAAPSAPGQAPEPPVSSAMTVGRSVQASRLYGSLDSRLPMAQVLVRAAVVRPAPMAAASHLALGATTLARTPVRTRPPATRRTWRSRSQRAGPWLTGAPACCQAVTAVQDVQVGQAGAGQEGLGLPGADAGAADQHDVLVEVRTASRCSRSRSSGTL